MGSSHPLHVVHEIFILMFDVAGVSNFEQSEVKPNLRSGEYNAVMLELRRVGLFLWR